MTILFHLHFMLYFFILSLVDISSSTFINHQILLMDTNKVEADVRGSWTTMKELLALSWVIIRRWNICIDCGRPTETQKSLRFADFVKKQTVTRSGVRLWSRQEPPWESCSEPSKCFVTQHFTFQLLCLLGRLKGAFEKEAVLYENFPAGISSSQPSRPGLTFLLWPGLRWSSSPSACFCIT